MKKILSFVAQTLLVKLRGRHLSPIFFALSRVPVTVIKDIRNVCPEFLTSLLLIMYLCVCSTILEEEKLQQKERNRMEMRRQVTVSWDSGGSDEAPPKVRNPLRLCLLASFGAATLFIHFSCGVCCQS